VNAIAHRKAHRQGGWLACRHRCTPIGAWKDVQVEEAVRATHLPPRWYVKGLAGKRLDALMDGRMDWGFPRGHKGRGRRGSLFVCLCRQYLLFKVFAFPLSVSHLLVFVFPPPSLPSLSRPFGHTHALSSVCRLSLEFLTRERANRRRKGRRRDKHTK